MSLFFYAKLPDDFVVVFIFFQRISLKLNHLTCGCWSYILKTDLARHEPELSESLVSFQ